MSELRAILIRETEAARQFKVVDRFVWIREAPERLLSDGIKGKQWGVFQD